MRKRVKCRFRAGRVPWNSNKIAISLGPRPALAPSVLNQHLARRRKKLVDLLLCAWIDHHPGPFANWARESWRGSKQAADQRPLRVNGASILAKVRAAQRG
jgi:hypothetical protein